MTDTTATQWATFYLAGELFALPVDEVQEVLMQQPLTPVPRAPEYVLGLLNLRGQVMPVIDLRRRLGFEPHPGGDCKQLVLTMPEGPISVLVDEIGDVLELPVDDWVAPPETLAARQRASIVAVCPIEQHLVLGVRAAGLGFVPDEGDATEGNVS